MPPFMTEIADFIETEITYDHMIGYRYLFNAVVLNHHIMEWMVVAHIWLDQQDARAYALAFKKVFDECKRINHKFIIGKSLMGIVIDWSDSEIKGLKDVLGQEAAGELLKGCKVHWIRLCQRVAERIASSSNKKLESDIFMKISARIQTLQSAVDIRSCLF